MENTYIYFELPNTTIKVLTSTSIRLLNTTVFEFQRVALISDFPHLSALLRQNYEEFLLSVIIQRDLEESGDFDMIQSSLLESTEDSINVIEFISSDNFDNIHILIHCSILNLHFNMEIPFKLALFKFSTEQLFDNCTNELFSYIQNVKANKTFLQNQYYEMKEKLAKKLAENHQLIQMYAASQERYYKVMDDFGSVRKIIIDMDQEVAVNAEKFKIAMQKDIECIICNNAYKKVMMLPCCHLVSCKECAEVNLGVMRGNISRNSEVTCPVCRIRVKQAIEVFY